MRAFLATLALAGALANVSGACADERFFADDRARIAQMARDVTDAVRAMRKVKRTRPPFTSRQTPKSSPKE